MSLISSYANALKAQRNLETYVAQKIAETVNVENKQLIFNGVLEYNPETFVAIKKYPLLEHLIPSEMTDNMSRARIVFAKANSYMYFPHNVSFEEYTEIMKNKENIPIIDETYYYILRADSTRVIVDFTNSKSKTFKIDVP